MLSVPQPSEPQPFQGDKPSHSKPKPWLRFPDWPEVHYNLRERYHNKALIPKTVDLNDRDILVCNVYSCNFSPAFLSSMFLDALLSVHVNHAAHANLINKQK